MHVLYGFFLLSVLIAMATFTTLLHTLDHVTQYVAAACVAANMVVVVGAHILYWNVHFEEFQEAIPRMHRVRIGQQVTPEAEEPLHAPQVPVQAPLTRASLIELANQRGESLSLTSEDFEPPLLMPPEKAPHDPTKHSESPEPPKPPVHTLTLPEGALAVPAGEEGDFGESILPILARQLAFEGTVPSAPSRPASASTYSIRFQHGREWPLSWPRPP